jgi:hypothetical protein
MIIGAVTKQFNFIQVDVTPGAHFRLIGSHGRQAAATQPKNTASDSEGSISDLVMRKFIRVI